VRLVPAEHQLSLPHGAVPRAEGLAPLSDTRLRLISRNIHPIFGRCMLTGFRLVTSAVISTPSRRLSPPPAPPSRLDRLLVYAASRGLFRPSRVMIVYTAIPHRLSIPHTSRTRTAMTPPRLPHLLAKYQNRAGRYCLIFWTPIIPSTRWRRL